MALSDTSIRTSKPKERTYKVWDGGGLHIVVKPSGSRLWRLKYRVAGREKLLSIGPYPAVSLKAARQAREQAKEQLANGIDPSQAKRSLRHAAASAGQNTFGAVADEYLSKMRREERAAATMKKAEWLLGFARERIGKRPIREITAPEVLELLRKVEVRGRHESANRLRALIGRVFRYAVATARADNDPTFALRGALTRPKVTSRAAVTDKELLGGLLRAIDAFEGQPTTRAALLLMALLFPRPGELRYAKTCGRSRAPSHSSSLHCARPPALSARTRCMQRCVALVMRRTKRRRMALELRSLPLRMNRGCGTPMRSNVRSPMWRVTAPGGLMPGESTGMSE